jgi:hypothetical protein
LPRPAHCRFELQRGRSYFMRRKRSWLDMQGAPAKCLSLSGMSALVISERYLEQSCPLNLVAMYASFGSSKDVTANRAARNLLCRRDENPKNRSNVSVSEMVAPSRGILAYAKSEATTTSGDLDLHQDFRARRSASAAANGEIAPPSKREWNGSQFRFPPLQVFTDRCLSRSPTHRQRQRPGT